jgi:hypothetical protein
MDWRLSSIRLNQGRYRDYCMTRERPTQFDHAERAALRKALVGIAAGDAPAIVAQVFGGGGE